ncbi:MAG: lipocalin-like domain-containing protein [Bacteroidales bacterium]
MKNSKRSLALMAFVIFASLFAQSISAQKILDALGKGSLKDKVQGVVESVAGNYVKFNITGEWIYKGATIDLKSSNQLANLGSNVLGNTLDDKVNEQLKRLGIKPDLMRITFNSDSSFVVKMDAREFKGRYSYNKENQDLVLTSERFAKSIKVNVEVLATNIIFYFQADGMLSFVKGVAGNVKSESIQGISKLLGNYENMSVGFKFEAADGRSLKDMLN